MPLTFAQADALFRQDKMNELVADPEGRRFLKLRSLNRTEYLERLFQAAGMAWPNVGSRQLFDAAFNAGISTTAIEACARDIYREEREQRRANEAELVNQLYRVQEFNWGGLHQNSLKKTIVDNYVKKISDYDALCQSVENELLTSMRSYVVCSWYNTCGSAPRPLGKGGRPSVSGVQRTHRRTCNFPQLIGGRNRTRSDGIDTVAIRKSGRQTLRRFESFVPCPC